MSLHISLYTVTYNSNFEIIYKKLTATNLFHVLVQFRNSDN
jgi:hypothetical protein